MVGREDEVHFMLPAGWWTTAGLVLSLVGVVLPASRLAPRRRRRRWRNDPTPARRRPPPSPGESRLSR